MEPVVVWINGAFGVGKTTVSGALVREWDGAIMFDPERIGALLRPTIPRAWHTGDYQDFPLWRRLTVEAVSGLVTDYRRPVVVPMTLVKDACFREIIGGLRDGGVTVRHFALTASPATIRRRLLRRLVRPLSIPWALARVEQCCEVLGRPEFHEQIDTDGLSVTDVTARIRRRVAGSLQALGVGKLRAARERCRGAETQADGRAGGGVASVGVSRMSGRCPAACRSRRRARWSARPSARETGATSSGPGPRFAPRCCRSAGRSLRIAGRRPRTAAR